MRAVPTIGGLLGGTPDGVQIDGASRYSSGNAYAYFGGASLVAGTAEAEL